MKLTNLMPGTLLLMFIGTILIAGCNKDPENEGGGNPPGSVVNPEVPADAALYGVKSGKITYDLYAEEAGVVINQPMIYTFDDYGKKSRSEMSSGDPLLGNLVILRDLTQASPVVSILIPELMMYTELPDPTREAEYVFDGNDVGFTAPAGSTRSVTTIAGKQCVSYTWTNNDMECQTAGWKRILFVDKMGQQELKATSFTEINPPADTFTVPSNYIFMELPSKNDTIQKVRDVLKKTGYKF